MKKNRLALFKVEVKRKLCNSFLETYKVHQQRVKADILQKLIFDILKKHGSKLFWLKGTIQIHYGTFGRCL